MTVMLAVIAAGVVMFLGFLAYMAHYNRHVVAPMLSVPLNDSPDARAQLRRPVRVYRGALLDEIEIFRQFADIVEPHLPEMHVVENAVMAAGTGQSGWCLTRDHRACDYGPCDCSCHVVDRQVAERKRIDDAAREWGRWF